jgi:hypothetical protein
MTPAERLADIQEDYRQLRLLGAGSVAYQALAQRIHEKSIAYQIATGQPAPKAPRRRATDPKE